MKLSAALALACATPLLAGCIIIDGDDDGSGIDYDMSVSSRELGSVYGASVLPNRVEYRVTSNGCTDEESFDVKVRDRGDDRYALELSRVRADNCRAYLVEGVVVSYSFEQLGLPENADVAILNPVRRR